VIQREAENKIQKLRSKYPVILITGPRQSGKTTLVKKLFPKYEYKNLENPDMKLVAINDPRRFLGIDTKQKIIIDEIQEVPELASYIQAEVDEQHINSQFVLTGSQNFQISQTISQSLAGRVSQFELLPLTFSEILQIKKISLDDAILSGSYPGKYARNIDKTDFYRDYVNTYITRDVRSLKNVGDLSNFLRFMNLIAGRVGQIFNMNEIGGDLGIDYKTVQKWFSVLEASYIVFRLEPYYENFGKRIIKSPKIYFYDTGLVSYLLGINSIKELESHYSYGKLFENIIISEKIKYIWNKRLNEKIFFWRDNNQVEIDLVIDKGLEKDLIEIKSSKTYSQDMIKNLIKINPLLSDKYKVKSSIIYQGNFEQKINSVNLINWKNLNK